MSAENERDAEREAYAFARARAAAEEDPLRVAARLLAFLQAHPSGPHAREAAQAIETLAARLSSRVMREILTARLRELRARHLPPIEPASWKMSESLRRLLALELGPTAKLRSED